MTAMAILTVGPFDAADVARMHDAFYEAAGRRDIKFRVAEYGYASYDCPTDAGVMMGWYYTDGLKEWGNRMDFSYSRKHDGKPGSFPDDVMAVELAKHLGLNARECLRLLKILAP